MTSALERLAGPQGPLAAEPPDSAEFARFIQQGLQMLSDARVPGVSIHGRFLSAYTASHCLCLAALRYHGFRPRDVRYIVFQALPHSLGLGPEVWRVLDDAHRRRNLAEYAGDVDLTESYLEALIVACTTVADRIQALPPLS